MGFVCGGVGGGADCGHRVGDAHKRKKHDTYGDWKMSPCGLDVHIVSLLSLVNEFTAIVETPSYQQAHIRQCLFGLGYSKSKSRLSK